MVRFEKYNPLLVLLSEDCIHQSALRSVSFYQIFSNNSLFGFRKSRTCTQSLVKIMLPDCYKYLTISQDGESAIRNFCGKDESAFQKIILRTLTKKSVDEAARREAIIQNL